MRVSGIASTLLFVIACGRSPLLGVKVHDASPPGQDIASDRDATARTADAASDTSRQEAGPFRPETGSPLACSALAALASRGVLTPRHAKQVLFTKDRSSLVLRVDTGTVDEALGVRLPGGEILHLGSDAVDINWIGEGSRVLVRNASGDLIASPLDGGVFTLLARNTCEHLTSPDGARVLTFEDCDALSAMLTSVDTRTGSRTTLGRTARNAYGFGPNVVFSPSGEWFAYLEPSPAVDGGVSYDGTVRVVGSNNGSYALKSAPGASYPTFASDQVLLFTHRRPTNIDVDVRAHVLGRGDTSRVIARGVGFDGRFDQHVSPDGQWMLAAIVPLPDYQSSYALSAFSFDGREVALAGDLFPFFTTEMLWHSFAFAADNRHVVYLTARPAFGTSVVGRSGGATTTLSSEHSFEIPPAGNLVALIEARSKPMRVRLTSLDTTRDVAVAEPTTTPTHVTFTPNGSSVVFVEKASSSTPARLQHLSGPTGKVTALAQWNLNQLLPFEPCCNEPGPGYPIDPTGCFTLVDSDGDGDGGTRLILLPESDAK